jgi:hypothetical protein
MGELKQLGDGKNRQDAYRSGQFRMPVRWLQYKALAKLAAFK